MDTSGSLAALIEEWIARSKHNNLNRLSTRTQISYSSLERIYKGRVEKLSFDAAMAVLPVVATVAQRADFLARHYPQFFDLLKQDPHFANRSGPEELDCREMDEMMAEPVGFLLAQQLFSKAGITPAKVRELYGEMGLSYIAQLEAQNLVTIANGKLKTAFDYCSSSLEGNKRQIISAIRGFREESFPAGVGVMNTLSESVSLAGAKAIANEITSCLNRIRAIRDESPGDHVFVANLAVQLVDPQAASAETQNA